jgi:protein involved in polysaccharide export with SLBB domain
MLKLMFRNTLSRALALSCLLSALTCMPATAAYRLGSEDRIKIKVHEWRASLGEVYEWVALSGEFTIGVTGTISLPLIGEMRADGLTIDQVAQEISNQLQKKVGLRSLPDTSVEVVGYRPFYILGMVDKPGSYPYRPGLTILQSVSIAGGFDRSGQLGLKRIERELISDRTNLKILNLGIDSQIARRARLQAELERAQSISFPPEITRRESEPAIAKILASERLLFEARKEGLQSQTDSLRSFQKNLNTEIESLNAKLALKDRQLELLRKEVQTVTSLVQKGLAIESRQFALERATADAEGNRLDTTTAILRARQEFSRTEVTILELHNRRRTEIIDDLRATQAKLEEQWQQADSAQKLLYETELTAQQVGKEGDIEGSVAPTYSITRKVDGKVDQLFVSESTPVEPGDVVRVHLPTRGPDGNGRGTAPVATSLITRDDGAAASSAQPVVR